MATKSKNINIIGGVPKPEKYSTRKKYHSVCGCPECGNTLTEKLIRLRHSYKFCEVCKTEFDCDESF